MLACLLLQPQVLVVDNLCSRHHDSALLLNMLTQLQHVSLLLCQGAYFIGKAVWGKGYHELIDLMASHQAHTQQPVHLDIMGAGEDLEAIKQEAHRKQLDVTFLAARDHADEAVHDYKVCTSK